MIVVDVEQGSPAWLQARCGSPTASHAADILARGRYGTEAAARRHYKRQIIVEQLTDLPDESTFLSAPMRRGREREAAARAAYAAHIGRPVQTVGFIRHDVLRAGCSIDGAVDGFTGLCELKAPLGWTHWRYRLTGRVPGRYVAQMTHQLWITGAAWCDFVSYVPGQPLFVRRFHRAELDIAGYERAVRQFLDEVDAIVARLVGLRPLEFFAAAPLDVAQRVLSRCEHEVRARTSRPSAPVAARPLAPLFAAGGAR